MPEPTPSWHRETIPATVEEALAALDAAGVLAGFYLAGGTGLALHLGHRRSADLDLFRQTAFSPESLVHKLQALEGVKIRGIEPGTVHFDVRETKVSLLHYSYPLIFPVQRFRIIDVADPREIACMKVSAIASRSTRRDFIDLYVVAQMHGLPEILDWFRRKFASTPYSRVHVLKSLVYFEDAEREPMPHMLVPIEWQTVKTFFTTEIPRLTIS
ncbi:MAG: nucleotidyl transferase AbiEii/AbiGii toxin family protein [Acidobacteria bacterium]|nr:nucleotidyl transferase AbiEii/AbiGii toxin family protein [Acidobacteriota bacterium]